MSIRTLTTYFRQFGPITGARVSLATAARRLFDPCSTSSYSRSGEDRIIATILDPDAPGFYVDVGCHHPRKASNSFELYKRGWRGLTIDANPELIREQKALRPRDTSVCAVVSDTAGSRVLTEFEDPTIASLDPGHVAHWSRLRPVLRRREVQTTTLTTLFEQHGVPMRFELLSVDVERHDFEALSSLDLRRYRPKLMVVEMHDFDLLRPEDCAVYRLARDASYRLVGFAGGSGYFLDGAS